MSDENPIRSLSHKLVLNRSQSVGGDRFTLLRPLGRGGLGESWLARDEQLNRTTALKFLPAEILERPLAVETLWRETGFLRVLQHPQLICTQDLYKDEQGLIFITTDFVEGLMLTTIRLQQPEAVFRWKQFRPFALLLCDALAYAHDEGVIHGNLKPNNLLLDTKKNLRVADFGIAATVTEAMKSAGLTGSTRATIFHLSPQLLNNEKPIVTDDVYALGATLYELLSSKPPFYEGDIAQQIQNVPAEPLAERMGEFGLINDTPPAVAELITACLAKDAAKRPPDIQSIATQL